MQKPFISIVLVLTIANCAVADRIHDLAAKGDLKAIGALLAASPEMVNARNASGHTPLHIAAGGGYRELAALLLNKGAEIDAPIKTDGESKVTPLLSAIYEGRTEVALFLIGKGADTNVRYDSGSVGGYTTLHAAVYYMNSRVARALLEKGVDGNARANNEETPLGCLLRSLPRFGVKESDVKVMVAILLNAKADATKADKHGTTPLHSAVRNNLFEIAVLLINAGADVNAETEQNVRPLALALKRGDPKMIKLLKDKGATEAPKE